MQLITPAEAAKRIGVSHNTVRSWIRRAENPLPSVVVGQSGRNRKVITEAITPWLEAEAARNGTVK